MAQKYLLVSQKYWNQVTRDKEATTTVNNETSDQFQMVAEALPPSLLTRAKLTVDYLRNEVKLDDKNRVIYADGKIGSELHSLLLFTFGASKIKPNDYEKFRKILIKVGAPKNVISRNQWISLY